jgi:hypothetical protein
MAEQLLDAGVETPAGDVPIIPVSLIALGAYLAWFGVYYWGSDTKWPSDPIKSLLQGKGIPAPDRSGRTDAILTPAQSAAALQTGGQILGQVGPIVGGAGGTPPATGTAGGPAPAGATTMDKNQLMTLWLSAGGNIQTANLAAAHALAESSGRTWITSPNPDGGVNVGLWQLDTRGEGAGYTVAQLQDPTTNARLTVMKTSNGTNWSHWSADPTPYL